MSLTVTLPDDLEAFLRQRAQQMGIPVERLITRAIEERWATASKVSHLSDAEADLLQRIAAAVPAAIRQQRQKLHALSQQRGLTDEERDQYLRLTDQIETAEAERIELLSQLAALRGTSIPDVARQLGLRSA